MATLASIAHRFHENPTSKSAADELLQLQREQFDHDEYYHREIARLDMKTRLTHLTLHFAKYVGYLGKLSDDLTANSPSLQRVLVDSLIIAISMANTLNMRIVDKIDTKSCSNASLDELSRQLARSTALGNGSLLRNLLVAMSQSTGRMAKACEGLDHIESVDFREELKIAVIEVTKTTLAAAALIDLDIVFAIKARLAEVKARFIFHNPIL